MVKTYALFDVVGVKEALSAGSGSTVLKEFWRTADAWVNGAGNSFGQQLVLGGKRTEVPNVSVVTFSDSALVFTRPEFELHVFYKIVGSLKQALERNVGKVYCVVSRGEEVEHPALPALGMMNIDSDMKPAYFNVAGSGAAWVNMHLADRAIGKRTDWHNRFTLYAVGADSIPADMVAIDEAVFKSLAGSDTLVLALA